MAQIEQISRKDFEYSDSLTFPKLVVGIKHDPDSIQSYDFKDEREWLNIRHQTGGNAHNDNYLTVTVLKPKNVEILEKMMEINNCWKDSSCGFFGVNLDDLIIYRNQLKELLDVDCNHSYRDFEEGIYPINLTAENIRKLSSDEMPDNLDDLIKYERDFERIVGCFGRWNLYILGENSR